MERVVINIRASKNISGLVKVLVTSLAGLIKFFLNVEPCALKGLCQDFKYACPKQQFILQACPRRWLVRKRFGSYPKKVKINLV